jgi:hypothetical protein
MEWEHIPLLALAESNVPMQAAATISAGFQDCQAKFDREGMLESVARLASTPVSAERTPVCAGEGK